MCTCVRVCVRLHDHNTKSLLVGYKNYNILQNACVNFPKFETWAQLGTKVNRLGWRSEVKFAIGNLVLIPVVKEGLQKLSYEFVDFLVVT